MAKNILVLIASPRSNGNTDKLAGAFIEGAESAGHNVFRFLPGHGGIKPCLGCNYCAANGGKCVQDDEMTEIYEAFDKADVVVLASPLYFHSVSAQLKIIIDRLYAAGSFNAFCYEKKESVFLMTCMESSNDIFDRAIGYYNILLEKAFPWVNCGEICVAGLESGKDSIEGHKALDRARQLGMSI